MTTAIRAVWFDLYGTLLDLAPLADACDRVAPGRGDEFAAAWRAEQLRLTWLRTIADRWAGFEAVTAEALTTTARRSHIHPVTAFEGLGGAFDRLPVRSEARAVLDALRSKGIETGVLSNGSGPMITRVLASTGLDVHVDRAISVDAVERYKPHPDVYGLALAASGAAAESIGFVTANDWDAAGAAAAGMRTFWLAPGDAPPPPSLGDVAPERSSWDTLLEQLTGDPED